jgi:hypothetical protein
MKKGKAVDLIFRWFILGGALLMVVIGVCNGEAGTVLAKAINICLECIGIG